MQNSHRITVNSNTRYTEMYTLLHTHEFLMNNELNVDAYIYNLIIDISQREDCPRSRSACGCSSGVTVDLFLADLFRQEQIR